MGWGFFLAYILRRVKLIAAKVFQKQCLYMELNIESLVTNVTIMND